MPKSISKTEDSKKLFIKIASHAAAADAAEPKCRCYQNIRIVQLSVAKLAAEKQSLC